MPLFNNKRKDFSIQPPKQSIANGAFFVIDSANINFTYANNDLSADLTQTGVVANTYGDATNVPQFTVDIWGRITGVTLVPILGGGSWSLTGNAGTDGGVTNFLGTTDSAALQFRVNNVQAGYISDLSLTALGFESLSSFVTNSIAIGYRSLKNSVGDNLTGIGNGAFLGSNMNNSIGIGVLSLNGSTGSNVIAIGSNIVNLGFNNVIALGRNAIPTASNQFKVSSDVTHIVMPLNGQTNGYVLTTDGTKADWQPATGGGSSPLTTKGDLYTYDTADARLPVGLPTQVLLADPSTATGLKWGSNTTPPASGYYGAFSDITNQTAAVINTGYPMLLGVTDLTNGVTVVSGSRVTIANTGIYNIQWSGQITNTTASNHDVTIWLRKNGVDVAGSAGVVIVPPKHGLFNGHILPAWNYLIDTIAGDYYEFVWSTENISVYLSFTGAGSPPPSAASVIVTVTQQSGIMAGTGITAINTLTGAAQTLTVGTTGTDFAIVDSGVDHKFNLPTASALNRGALSSTDWSTFNAKAPIASPAFTGSPTAPTQSSSDNSTKIATTAYVDSAVGAPQVGSDLYLFYNY